MCGQEEKLRKSFRGSKGVQASQPCCCSSDAALQNAGFLRPSFGGGSEFVFQRSKFRFLIFILASSKFIS